MQQLRVLATFVVASATVFGVLHFAGNVFGILGMLIAAGVLYLLVPILGEKMRERVRDAREETDEV